MFDLSLRECIKYVKFHSFHLFVFLLILGAFAQQSDIEDDHIPENDTNNEREHEPSNSVEIEDVFGVSQDSESGDRSCKIWICCEM